MDGSLRPKVSVYNKQLEEDITREIDAMRRGYRHLVDAGKIVTASAFEEAVAKELNPKVVVRKEENTLLGKLDKFVEDGYRDGIFGKSRYKHYSGVRNRMGRYLKINGLVAMAPSEFDDDQIMKLRQFLFDEYLYVPKHKNIYKDLKKVEIPTRRRGSKAVERYTNMEIRDDFALHNIAFRQKAYKVDKDLNVLE